MRYDIAAPDPTFRPGAHLSFGEKCGMNALETGARVLSGGVLARRTYFDRTLCRLVTVSQDPMPLGFPWFLLALLCLSCGRDFSTEVFHADDAAMVVLVDAGNGDDASRLSLSDSHFESGREGGRVRVDAVADASPVPSDVVPSSGGVGASVGSGGAGGNAPPAGGAGGGVVPTCERYVGAVYVCAAGEATFYPCPVPPPGCTRAGSTALVCCPAVAK